MNNEGLPQNTAEHDEAFSASAFLKENGLETLQDRMVMDHEGNPMTLGTALAECEPARKAIEGAVEMAKEFGDGEVLAPMTKYLDKLSAQAQSPEAKKKEMKT